MGYCLIPFLVNSMYLYKGCFAGIELYLNFHFNETAQYYGHYLEKAEDPNQSIEIPEDEIEKKCRIWNIPDPAFEEYVLSCSYICDALMLKNRIVFHGASFLWRQKAYIFTAPSGTGKTTQIKHWLAKYGNEIEVLNGDKPILEFKDNGSVFVHPSPWKGKEGIGRDDIIAPLGGIILLKKAHHNTIERMSPDTAAKNLFCRFYSTFSSEKEILIAAQFLEHMVETVPVWQLANKGDTESTILTHEILETEVENEI